MDAELLISRQCCFSPPSLIHWGTRCASVCKHPGLVKRGGGGFWWLEGTGSPGSDKLIFVKMYISELFERTAIILL